MKVTETSIEGVLVIEPDVFHDERGLFFESFSEERFAERVYPVRFVQDNHSESRYGVVRGLHFQRPPFEQAKLVRAVSGTILDVAVDIRSNSPTFGKYVAVELSGENRRQLFVPHGFAHGFSVLSEEAVVNYKCDGYYSPEHEMGVAWNDPEINIDWRIPQNEAIVSFKDRNCLNLQEIIKFSQ